MNKLCITSICTLLCIALVGCSRDKPASGTLEIAYTLNQPERIVPSYQTAIWLEDSAGAIVKSLLVSEYLSTGGYKKDGICSAWSAKSGWAAKKPKEIIPITAATPKIDCHTLKIDCRAANIAPGRYRYCVQTHIVEDYNILYTGQITIGEHDNQSTAEVTHIPKKHERGSNALTGVKATYYQGAYYH